MPGINGFIDFVKSLSPAMATAFIRGSVECWDSYARPRIITPGTAGVGLAFRRGEKGYYLSQEKSAAAGGGSVSIVDSGAAPELRVASGTLFWTARNFQTLPPDYVTAIKSRVYSKVDEGGTDLEVIIQGANTLWIADGVSIRTVASTALTGARTVAIRWVTGAIPQLFVDGTFRANAAGTIAPTGNDANLTLLNYGAVLSYGSRINDYGLMCAFNDAILGRALTDAEIKNLSDLWDQIGSVFTGKSIFFPPDPKNITGSLPLVYFDGPRNGSNIVPNKGSLETDFTISGCLQQRSDKGHIIHSAPGRGGANGPLAQTPVNASLYPDPWTIAFKCLIKTKGENGSGQLLWLDTGGGQRATIYFGGAPVNALAYSIYYSDPAHAIWTVPISPNVTHIVVIRHNKVSPLTLPEIWVDGESQTVTALVARAGALVTAPSARVELFNTYSPTAIPRAFDGDLEIFALDSGLWTDAQVRKFYLDHALECNVLANRTDYPVSVAAVAAGGNCGPVRVLSGTMKWDDTGTRRRLLGVTAGYFASREASPQAYGAWYFRARKGTAAGVLYLPLIGSVPAILTASNFNGYALVITDTEIVRFQKWINGAGSIIAATAADVVAINTEYELCVTRASVTDAFGHLAGYWTVWIRGGAYATWTSLLTGTDNTHTTSNCLVGYLDAGGYISDYRQYPNGSGLVPTDVPDLAD
ncbi:MAG: hypothetical protein WC683_18150 [bacterium]